MNVETLHDLFVYELEEVYRTETELEEVSDELANETAIDSLDDFSDAETRESLADVFADHGEETAAQADRLERVFEAVDRRPDGRGAPAFTGILDGKDWFDNVVYNDAARLLFYLDFGRNVEQMEIRAYESLLENGRAFGLPDDAVGALESNLDEERNAAERLAALAESDEVGALREETGEQSPELGPAVRVAVRGGSGGRRCGTDGCGRG